jgi:hypothetical protein
MLELQHQSQPALTLTQIPRTHTHVHPQISRTVPAIRRPASIYTHAHLPIYFSLSPPPSLITSPSLSFLSLSFSLSLAPSLSLSLFISLTHSLFYSPHAMVGVQERARTLLPTFRYSLSVCVCVCVRFVKEEGKTFLPVSEKAPGMG